MPPTKPSNERVLLVCYRRETLDCLDLGLPLLAVNRVEPGLEQGS